MAADTVLEVNNIEVVYNKTVQVLRGLSLAVPEGKVVALLGSNGAGKSTTLKAISNVLSLEDGEVTAGSIVFQNEAVARHQPHELVRSGLFHVMEGRRIFEDLTVEENLTAATYALSGRKVPPTKFEVVYEYFPRLFERRTGRAGYLSGGEQQMLAIGRALIAQPKLMLLDEPSLGLSPKLVEEIFTIIARINPVLRGWGNYFRTGNADVKFNRLDSYVWWRLHRFLVKRKGRHHHRQCSRLHRPRATTLTRRMRLSAPVINSSARSRAILRNWLSAPSAIGAYPMATFSARKRPAPSWAATSPAVST